MPSEKTLTNPNRPPNTEQPWIWLNGRWWLVATDTSDGVPDSLDLPKPQQGGDDG